MPRDTSKPKLSLEEFVALEQKRLVSFNWYWRNRQKERPSLFPDEMLTGDWDEQFHLFSDNEF